MAVPAHEHGLPAFSKLALTAALRYYEIISTCARGVVSSSDPAGGAPSKIVSAAALASSKRHSV